MIDFRPCGACGELVSPFGCEHWKPGRASLRGGSTARSERKRQRDRELIAAKRAAVR